ADHRLAQHLQGPGGNGVQRYQHPRLEQVAAIGERLHVEILRLGAAQVDAFLVVGSDVVMVHDGNVTLSLSVFECRSWHAPTMVGLPTAVKLHLPLFRIFRSRPRVPCWLRTSSECGYT